MALAGGVSVALPPRAGYLYQKRGMHVARRPLPRRSTRAAAGTVFGSGAGVVVLKRLADALADGDTIHAVIQGSAVNNDGVAKAGFTAPSVDGQADVMRRGAGRRRGRASDDRLRRGARHRHRARRPDRGRGADSGFRHERRTGTPATPARSARSSPTSATSTPPPGIAGLIKTVLALKHQPDPAEPALRPSPTRASISRARRSTSTRACDTVAGRAGAAARRRQLVRHRRHQRARDRGAGTRTAGH